MVLVVFVANLLLILYRVQFLLGDKTLSPNSFPSSYVDALLAVDLELEPYSSIVDNAESHRALARMAPSDLHPSIALVHCKKQSI